jgi:hypothetical protein
MKINPSLRNNRKATYKIKMKGSISQRWAGWFGNLTILDQEDTDQPDLTTITVDVADQAAFLGALQKLHNLGCSLLEVKLINDARCDQRSDKC